MGNDEMEFYDKIEKCFENMKKFNDLEKKLIEEGNEYLTKSNNGKMLEFGASGKASGKLYVLSLSAKACIEYLNINSKGKILSVN